MDVLFNLENGIYAAHRGASLIVEIAINILSFSIPTYIISFAWRSRFALLGARLFAER
jgi:hypothetical protein